MRSKEFTYCVPVITIIIINCVIGVCSYKNQEKNNSHDILNELQFTHKLDRDNINSMLKKVFGISNIQYIINGKLQGTCKHVLCSNITTVIDDYKLKNMNDAPPISSHIENTGIEYYNIRINYLRYSNYTDLLFPDEIRTLNYSKCKQLYNNENLTSEERINKQYINTILFKSLLKQTKYYGICKQIINKNDRLTCLYNLIYSPTSQVQDFKNVSSLENVKNKNITFKHVQMPIILNLCVVVKSLEQFKYMQFNYPPFEAPDMQLIYFFNHMFEEYASLWPVNYVRLNISYIVTSELIGISLAPRPECYLTLNLWERLSSPLADSRGDYELIQYPWQFIDDHLFVFGGRIMNRRHIMNVFYDREFFIDNKNHTQRMNILMRIVMKMLYGIHGMKIESIHREKYSPLTLFEINHMHLSPIRSDLMVQRYQSYHKENTDKIAKNDKYLSYVQNSTLLTNMKIINHTYYNVLPYDKCSALEASQYIIQNFFQYTNTTNLTKIIPKIISKHGLYNNLLFTHFNVEHDEMFDSLTKL